MKAIALLSQFFSRFRRGYSLKNLDDYPEEIGQDILYVVGDLAEPQYAVFRCPCGCGRPVELNLNKHSLPSWELKWHVLGTVTVAPSIWRKDGCRSHYFLRRSKVIWCD